MASALLAHLWDGRTEANFHFFVVIPILILYQDWAPFLLALGYVVLHHGILGTIAPGSVYSHADAVAHPWLWALIDGGFVLAACAASLVSWAANEQMLREPLTGLPGRTVFLQRVRVALARLKRRDSTVALLFLDLDRFKTLNDALGHAVGDRILVQAARRLQGCVRRHDTLARLGGDEFAILCERLRSGHEATTVADRVLDALRRPFHVGSTSVVTGASVGIATTFSETEADRLMGDADAAMYRAKRRHGDRYVVFDETMRQEITERLATETGLRRALECDELALHYQPIISATFDEIVGFEALLRWQHPERGMVPPLDFIPVAEHTGLIVPIGRWVLRRACRDASRWGTLARDPARAPYVSVNLSARQFAQPGIVDAVTQTLEETGLEPERLALEVTESAVMEDLDEPDETLRELKALGVRLFLDDFGTGYSSLSYLQRFPIDMLKVDRSFVSGIDQGDGKLPILGAVVGMARALGMEVVAEGVETGEQLERLRNLGCELAQGFYFAGPTPLEDLEEMVASGRARDHEPAPAAR
jgi:diguanylate cyclase (GGDEF)-like protein